MNRLVSGVLGVLLLASVARAGKQDFVLVNKTTLTIDQLHVSPHDEDDWQEDVLGKDVLRNDERVEISFSREESTCVWDVKIVDDEGDSVDWESIDLCKASEITLKYEGKHPTASIK